MFGNKGLIFYHSQVDIHGIPRNVTWTMLSNTAEIGTTEINLLHHTDWKVGEEIVVAPTDYSLNHSEVRTIIGVKNYGATLVLDKPLDYRHYSAVEKYGDEEFPMRAEVGLLTRNIRI